MMGVKFVAIVGSSLIWNANAFAPHAGIASTSALSMSTGVDDKTEVREYFNNEGFSRWNKIYSENDEVNSVQLDIRTGHDETISKILKWVEEDGDIKGKSVCDCGCGVGSLAIPLASMGKHVYSLEKHTILFLSHCFYRRDTQAQKFRPVIFLIQCRVRLQEERRSSVLKTQNFTPLILNLSQENTIPSHVWMLQFIILRKRWVK